MTEPLLAVRGLEAGYDGHPVVRGLDLEVHAGQAVCLVGANGAGKTTTLHAVLGLRPPSAGSVRFDGAELRGTAPHRLAARGLSLVPEGRRVFASLSARENLRVGGRAVRGGGDPGPALELFPELADQLDRPAGLLSGGQQQMLAIARALMARPRLLVLDEPSMGLSPRLVSRIYAALERIRSTGTTILLAEQNARRALALADHAYLLELGRIVESSPATEARQSPRIARTYLGGS